MSDRLTARSPKNNMAYLVGIKPKEQSLEGSYNTLLCVRDAFEALATYEETGFSPSEISELKAKNARLKLQLEKVLEALSPKTVDGPCPNHVGLENCTCSCFNITCGQCWRKALEAI